MKVFDIINEDAADGTSMAGNFASVSFPLFGKKKQIRRAVDPKGYLGDGKLKLPKVGYNKPVKVKESVNEKVYKKFNIKLNYLILSIVILLIAVLVYLIRN